MKVNYRTIRAAEWLVAFIAIVLAIWFPLRSQSAPQLILLIFLYIIAINFSVPVSVGYSGLAPLVAIVSLLALGLESALMAAITGGIVAEVIRPLWKPLQNNDPSNKTKSQRFQRYFLLIILWISVLITGLANSDAVATPTLVQQIVARIPNTTEATFVPVILTLIFLIVNLILQLLYWMMAGGELVRFFQENIGFMATSSFVAIPLALFIASADNSTPAFVLLSIGIGSLAIISWLSWQRRYMMERRLAQFSALNEATRALQETLDLPTLLRHALTDVRALMTDTEVFQIILKRPDGQWEQPILSTEKEIGMHPFPPDDLTKWVVEQRRTLELDQHTLHFVETHGLALPEHAPKVWVGVPLVSAEQTIGALVIKKHNDDEPFTRWTRELLQAVAGHIGGAIQNARLHSETVRLYNLTDEALAERVEQLQALLFSIVEGVLMLDLNGRILLVNPTAATLLGRDVTELNQTLLNIDDSAEALGYSKAELTTLIDSLQTTPDLQLREAEYKFTQDKDSNHKIIRRIEVPVTGDNAQTIGWLMVFRDVTELRERAEWRADLTRMIVHDLRNPVTTVSSSVEIISDRLPEQQRLDLGNLITSAQSGCAGLIEMVDSLLDINRAEVGKFIIDPDAMRLNTLAERVLSQLQPLAEIRQIQLSVVIPDDLPPVWGDSEILRRVFVNLFDNALKFTPANGQVTGILSAEPATHIDHEAGVRVTIIDTGPGIPLDKRQRIFDRFITFNRGGGQIRGTGLGLSFCKLAVEAHNGQIWVEQTETGGSAFIFTVPGMPYF